MQTCLTPPRRCPDPSCPHQTRGNPTLQALQEKRVWCCQGDAESSVSSAAAHFENARRCRAEPFEGPADPRGHLSSATAKQSQPVDPVSDRSSGNPQTCLFLKAALTRPPPAPVFPAVHFIFCLFFPSNPLQWICYFHYNIQLCLFDAASFFYFFFFVAKTTK